MYLCLVIAAKIDLFYEKTKLFFAIGYKIQKNG